MRPWIYGTIMLIGLASPSILRRVRVHRGREPRSLAPAGRGAVGRFLFEGRTRWIGYVAAGAVHLVVLLASAWYFSQPNYAKGPDQMHAAPGFPAWLLFPIAVVAWIVMMADFMYTNECFEAGRRRRLRELDTAPDEPRANRALYGRNLHAVQTEADENKR